MMKQSDIPYEVARETGHSEELVIFVIRAFWRAVRYYLTHPLEAKQGILIHGLGCFYMNPFTVDKLMKELLIKTKGKITPKVEFYQQILKLYEYEEGQESQEYFYE